MNLEHVSVENRKQFRQSYPSGFEESTIFSPPYGHTNPGDKNPVEHPITNPEIARILQRLSDRSLCGYDQVKLYLQDLYRRNCRPSTIRGNGTTIIFF